MQKSKKKITVCANCLTEACWHGEIFCEKYRIAGTVDLTKRQILKRRHKMGWIEKHSVNCYFCGTLFDEREGQHADPFNNNDGGEICPKCLEEKAKEKCPTCQTELEHIDIKGEDVFGCPKCKKEITRNGKEAK